MPDREGHDVARRHPRRNSPLEALVLVEHEQLRPAPAQPSTPLDAASASLKRHNQRDTPGTSNPEVFCSLRGAFSRCCDRWWGGTGEPTPPAAPADSCVLLIAR
jgi:hypothetical protein